MVIHMVFGAIKMLDFFFTKGGVSDNLSPKIIMTGESLDYRKHFILLFGQYEQVQE